MTNGKLSSKEFLIFDVFGCIWNNEKSRFSGYLKICYNCNSNTVPSIVSDTELCLG